MPPSQIASSSDLSATGTPSAAGQANSAADENPWPGLDFYTEKTARHFHGRTDEAEELLSRLRRRRITVLYGQSGLGKSSVLQAGLFPLVRRDGWMPIYIRLRYSAIGSNASGALEPLISQALKEIACEIRGELKDGRLRLSPDQPGEANTKKIEEVLPVSGETMWDYLHRPGVTLFDANGRGVALVLAFDQFEEIFTLGRNVSRAIGGSEFMRDLARCAEEEPPPHVGWGPGEAAGEFSQWGDHRFILSLREDFLAQLNDLGWQMPTLLENQMHLRALTGWQALDAVSKPGRGLTDPLVAREIVESVAAKRRDEAEAGDCAASAGPEPGGSSEQQEYAEMKVDPAILSMTCRELNEARRRENLPKITSELVARLLHNDEQSIFRRFYEESFAGLTEGEAPVMRREDVAPLKRFIEEKLLQGRRRDVINYERAEAELMAAGIDNPDAVLGHLIDHRRLLRKAPGRGGTAWVLELAHDVLCDPVVSSRDARIRDEAEAKRLLDLEKAAEREKQEREKRQHLEKEIAELKTRRKLVRAVVVLTIFSVLAMGAAALFSMKVIGIGRAANKRATEYLGKAEEWSGKPGLEWGLEQNAFKALRYATMALIIDGNNTASARIASRLLLEKRWCIPLSPPLKYDQQIPIMNAGFTPDGKAITAVTGDGRLLLWDARTYAASPPRDILPRRQELSKSSRVPVSSAVFSRDGHSLIFTWTAEPATPAATPAPGAGSGTTTQQNTKTAIWQWKNGAYEDSHIELSLDTSLRSAAWSDDGNVLLVVMSKLGEIICRVFDLSTGSAIRLNGPLCDPATRIAAADLDHDGNWIATANGGGELQFWGVPSLEPKERNGKPEKHSPTTGVKPDSRIFALSISRDSRFVVTSGSLPSLRVWTLGGKLGSQDVDLKAPVRATLSPVMGGDQILATGLGKMALLWKVGDHVERISEPMAVEETFTTPIYSPDGSRLITLSGGVWMQGETIRVWRAAPLSPAPAGVAITGNSPPRWLPKLAEAVTGSRVTLDFDNTVADTLDKIRTENGSAGMPAEYRPLWDRFFSEN